MHKLCPHSMFLKTKQKLKQYKGACPECSLLLFRSLDGLMFKIIIIIITKEKEKGSVGNPSKSFTLWEVQLSGDRHHLYPLPSCPRHDETVGPEGSTWKTEGRQKWTLDQWVRVQGQHPNPTDPEAVCSKNSMWSKLSHSLPCRL